MKLEENKSVKRLSTTRWSAHYRAVKGLADNFEELVDKSNGRENVDTRGAAHNLMPAVCNYTFLCYLFFSYDVLRETNAAPIAITLCKKQYTLQQKNQKTTIFQQKNIT
ncbi:unnamed protein product [Pieris brassicae]|uniref:Uncharacterized protein n=1 Tax=Pieris brassicae TaxID=7116 RepID=A0A9P0T1M1_PIEBR|nr:unnamed protein product [Pieris brassicae]